jgi:hypothetical protein
MRPPEMRPPEIRRNSPKQWLRDKAVVTASGVVSWKARASSSGCRQKSVDSSGVTVKISG